MILIHIIRKKQTNKQKTFLPTHIKHNSSKIITIIITITYNIDSITWTFCTISFKLAIGRNISQEFFVIDRFIFCRISFKLAIGRNISKEFLRLIDLFSIQFQGTCDRSVQIFKRIARSVQLKCYYSWESCDRSVQIFKEIRRSITKYNLQN